MHLHSYADGTYFANMIFHDENLEVMKNVLIIVENGIIKDFIPNATRKQADVTVASPDSSFLVFFPSFLNAHVHSQDYFLAGIGWRQSLKELVGKNGLKTNALKHTNYHVKLVASRKYFQALKSLGFSTVIDFRENGILGAQSGKEASDSIGINHLVLSRVRSWKKNVESFIKEVKYLLEVSDGLGIPDLKRWGLENIILASQITQEKQKLVAIHVAESLADKQTFQEQGFSDVEIALTEVKADILVHLTHVTHDEFSLLKEYEQSKMYVLCPRANIFFNTGSPLIHEFIRNDIPFTLGTDNAFTMTPSFLEEIRFILLTNKKHAIISPRVILQAATGNLLPKKFNAFKHTLSIGQRFNPQIFAFPFKIKRDPYTTFAFHAHDMYRLEKTSSPLLESRSR